MIALKQFIDYERQFFPCIGTRLTIDSSKNELRFYFELFRNDEKKIMLEIFFVLNSFVVERIKRPKRYLR